MFGKDKAPKAPTKLVFEKLETNSLGNQCKRAKIPGGWLVNFYDSAMSGPATGLTFVPDLSHEWNGCSVA